MDDRSDLLPAELGVVLLKHDPRVLLENLLALPPCLGREAEEVEVGGDVFRAVVGEEDEQLGGGRCRGKAGTEEVGMLGVIEHLKQTTEKRERSGCMREGLQLARAAELGG